MSRIIVDAIRNSSASSDNISLDSNARVGIGTSSPPSILSVEQSSSNVSADLHATGSGRGSQIKFHNDHGLAYIGQAGDTSGDFIIFNSTASNLKFYTNDNEHLRINSDGQLFMNCTAGSSEILQIRNTVGSRACLNLGTAATNTDTLAAFMGGCNSDGSGGGQRGTITITSSSTAYNTSSDYRLKENITSISDGITRLKTLKPSRFNFKIDKDTTVDGFIAHEVTAVPEAIVGTKDEVDKDNKPVYQEIDQSKLVPLLTAALQEAVAKIETLETKVTALEAA